MKDVHAMAPTQDRLMIRRVGVSEIRKPISVQRPERIITLSATFAVAVDLPSNRKGSDLSRNAELLAELVDQTVTRPVSSLESACSEIARELLVRHTYATEASVQAEAEYFLRRGISEDRRSFENFSLFAEARASRLESGSVRVVQSIGAGAVGMTACPCAMETAREKLTIEFPLLADPSLRDLPIITHNQRNRTRLDFEAADPVDIEADIMLDAIEHAQSSPTYAILKRGDEAQVVLDAHRRPKFVEDVVRDLLVSLPARFPDLPDAVGVRVRTVSEESIHKYNVEAAHHTTMGDLRKRALP
ncbi:MAG: GTP cyclohydrolase MptA [Thermoplasmata archaeon]